MLRLLPTRRSTSIAFAAFLAFAVLMSVRPAQGMRAPHPTHQAKQQIEALEEQWRSAVLAGDLNSMNNMLSDDFVGISWNGEVNTKATQIDRVRTRNFVVTSLTPVETKVKVVGNVAIVTGRAAVQGTSDGTSMNGMFRFTRVYQKLPSGSWKITNFEATRVPDAGPHHVHGIPFLPGSARSSRNL